jgi:hypothetical protein
MTKLGLASAHNDDFQQSAEVLQKLEGREVSEEEKKDADDAGSLLEAAVTKIVANPSPVPTVLGPGEKVKAHWSEVLVKGAQPNIFGPWIHEIGFEPTTEPKTVARAGLEATLQATDAPSTLLTYEAGGWAHLCATDPGLSILELTQVQNFSKKVKGRVVMWSIDQRGGDLAAIPLELAVVSGGDLRQVGHAADGSLISEGKKLPEEGSVNWKTANLSDLYKVLDRLGIHYGPTVPVVPFTIYQGDIKIDPSQVQVVTDGEDEKK